MLVVWASVYRLFSPVEDLTSCVWLVVYEECYFSFKLGRKASCHLEMARLVCSGPGGIKYACISQNMKLLLGMLWKGLKEVSRLLLLLYLGFISLGISVYRCSARPWIPVFTALLLLPWKPGPLLLWLRTGRTLWTAKCDPSEKQTHTEDYFNAHAHCGVPQSVLQTAVNTSDWAAKPKSALLSPGDRGRKGSGGEH